MKTALFALAIFFHGTVFLNMWMNMLYVRQVRRRAKRPEVPPRLSVIIPARNEEANLKTLIPSLLAQTYPDFEVLIYDDASEDGTWQMIEQANDVRIRGLQGHGPAEGWLGKPHALYQASRHATGELFLFLDADAKLLRPNALDEFVAQYLGTKQPSYMSAMPKLTGGGLLIVSQVPYLVVGCIPMSFMRFGRFKSLSMLNGQFWLIRRDLYFQYEPHLHVKDAVLEDVEIGRYLKGNRVIPHLMDIQDLLEVRMYDDFKGAWNGFRKNFYLVLGGNPLAFSILWSGLTLVLVVAPLVWTWFLIPIFINKMIIDRYAKLPFWITLLAPLGFLLVCILKLHSALSHWTGRVTWKGRNVAKRKIIA